MKVLAFAGVVGSLLMLASVTPASSTHIRVHVNIKAADQHCYLDCPSGTYCVLGDTECRPPPEGKCLNPATYQWIDQCARGFVCVNGKCEVSKAYKHKKPSKGDGDDASLFDYCFDRIHAKYVGVDECPYPLVCDRSIGLCDFPSDGAKFTGKSIEINDD